MPATSDRRIVAEAFIVADRLARIAADNLNRATSVVAVAATRLNDCLMQRAESVCELADNIGFDEFAIVTSDKIIVRCVCRCCEERTAVILDRSGLIDLTSADA